MKTLGRPLADLLYSSDFHMVSLSSRLQQPGRGGHHIHRVWSYGKQAWSFGRCYWRPLRDTLR